MDLCEQARTLCQLLVDNELTAGERARLNEHLNDCLECRRFREWLEEAALLVATEERVEAPAELEERILGAVLDSPAEDLPTQPKPKPKPRPKAGRLATVRRTLAPISYAAEKLRRKPATPDPPSGTDFARMGWRIGMDNMRRRGRG